MASATAPDTTAPDEVLNRVFSALSDPTRRSIVTQLAQGEATMSEIAGRFDMSLPGVSKHVTVLEEAGLVHRWRTGRVRRCRLEPAAMTEAQRWIVDRTSFWNETLDQLADYVEDREGPR